MHLLVRETRTLDEQAEALDHGHAPADLLVLSFSDSDLAALASAELALRADGFAPSLRLQSLGSLRHPMSVDLYAENTIAGSGCVFVRLLGGLDHWRYGAEELAATCHRQGIPLAMVPGDAQPDPRLAALSTVPEPVLRRLDGFLREGGPRNHRAALELLAHLAGYGADHGLDPQPVPTAGLHRPAPEQRTRPLATILFYRAHLVAEDIAPFEALAEALDRRGLDAELIFVASLKEPAAARFVRDRLRATQPAVVLNATFFSARGEDGSPLDAAEAPVIQLLQPASDEPAWAASRRGLSQADLAMQVVLPELDGRLAGTAISFKRHRPETAPGGFAARYNAPHADGIALIADRAAGWARLAGTPRAERRIAVILSDYPALGGQTGHAVGLDVFASLHAILETLRTQGYDTGPVPDQASLVQALCHDVPAPILDAAALCDALDALPAPLRDRVAAGWDTPRTGVALRHLRLGRIVVAIQPDRGDGRDRKAGYHDPDLPPHPTYIGVHHWLRRHLDIHAVVHLGAHGTLEWLPGKATAPSIECAPSALLGGLPVIYPFICNNPGEAAAAKRRLGAVTIGHLTPPIGGAGLHGDALELERLIDEFAAADGLDARRGRLLRRDILDRAEACGLLAESGVEPGSDDAEALARLDAYLCDVKEMQIRDGLHVFGRPPPRREALLAAIERVAAGERAARGERAAEALDASPQAEMRALLAALDGRFVEPGPAGAPTRGRADVLPTGRNLFSVDPRAIPTRSAVVLAEKAARALLERHMQDQGDWLRSAMIDLWGSTSLRTGGEDLALALILMGVKPVWDAGSNRVSGLEIVPLPVLDRPRVDVTLRISGLFRDAFPAQIALFDQAVQAVAAREEPAEWNALAAAARGLDGAARETATARIFGAAPGSYGTGLERRLAAGDWGEHAELGALYLDGGFFAYGGKREGEAQPDAFRDRVTGSEALLHIGDMAETDLLDGLDVAAHAGGFAAAAASLGAQPAIYHADTARPETPRLRTAAEELARVVRGRAANPDWIAGMKQHGYRGAAEIARTLDALHGFAALLPDRFDRQFELLFGATLGNAETERFLREANPDAHAAMQARFAEAVRRGLWRPRRNDLGDGT
ncbi:cobaltochelatase subunit CobN [Acetobacteraceae bacterium KSS8]|uniref:Cobaltochelatase subunit CobN n=1 Tax=Endosaccharibacter trunci TaxID=2812733 RepID=A0ABT1W2K5_9PROT|nr:cobaltochelatase subunit CobN [Acetobacteraceae bacterium KSS8]